MQFTALRWLAAGHEPVSFLTTAPRECSADPSDAALRTARDRGRAAFESPVLVGGPAGSLGVSCASCHRAGRGNPEFFIPRMSSDAGTADVSSSVFSKVRDDGVFNPKPIPDIALRDGTQIRDRTGPEFREKLRGLIVEEFEGQKPPASVFEDVRVYLDTLTPSACPANTAPTQIHVARDLAAVRTALDAAQGASADEQLFWMNVARRRLEQIDERFQRSSLSRERTEIEAINRRLAAAQASVRRGRFFTPISDRDWSAFAAAIAAGEARSSYNPNVLRTQL